MLESRWARGSLVWSRRQRLGLRRCVAGIPSQVCLLSRFSLLLTCAGCVDIEDSSSIPFGTMVKQGGVVASP